MHATERGISEASHSAHCRSDVRGSQASTWTSQVDMSAINAARPVGTCTLAPPARHGKTMLAVCTFSEGLFGWVEMVARAGWKEWARTCTERVAAHKAAGASSAIRASRLRRAPATCGGRVAELEGHGKPWCAFKLLMMNLLAREHLCTARKLILSKQGPEGCQQHVCSIFTFLVSTSCAASGCACSFISA
eukprot:366301-Chlamydomonas_euryale.AAC.24